MDANADDGAGDGRKTRDPLVILPGLLCDGRMFQAQIDAFDAQVIGDFYGSADTLPAMADHALARMPDRCVLLGHSMGARVALEVWRKAPDRVAGLVLADTGIHPVKPGEREARMALLAIGEQSGADALVDAWLPPMLGRAAARDRELYATLSAMCIDAGVATYARQIGALLARPDAAGVLPTITCPTLILVGAEDRWSPVAQHQEMADRVRDARLGIVPEAGHMAPAEMPDAFNMFLREWLARDAMPHAVASAGEDWK